MTVTKTNYGRFNTLTGTLAEVVAALNAERADDLTTIQVSVDAAGTAYYAVYYK